MEATAKRRNKTIEYFASVRSFGFITPQLTIITFAFVMGHREPLITRIFVSMIYDYTYNIQRQTNAYNKFRRRVKFCTPPNLIIDEPGLGENCRANTARQERGI